MCYKISFVLSYIDIKCVHEMIVNYSKSNFKNKNCFYFIL